LYFLSKFSCKIATTSKTHQLRLAGIRTSRVRRRPFPASGRCKPKFISPTASSALPFPSRITLT